MRVTPSRVTKPVEPLTKVQTPASASYTSRTHRASSGVVTTEVKGVGCATTGAVCRVNPERSGSALATCEQPQGVDCHARAVVGGYLRSADPRPTAKGSAGCPVAGWTKEVAIEDPTVPLTTGARTVTYSSAEPSGPYRPRSLEATRRARVVGAVAHATA